METRNVYETDDEVQALALQEALESAGIAAVLALGAQWPEMRIVLSLHNYYPFCPQVNLWHAERETCDVDEREQLVLQ